MRFTYGSRSAITRRMGLSSPPVKPARISFAPSGYGDEGEADLILVSFSLRRSPLLLPVQ